MPHSIHSLLRNSSTVTGVLAVVYLVLASAIIWYSEYSHVETERQRAAAIGKEYAYAVQHNIEQALSSSYALAAMVQLNKGDVPEFDTVAAALRSFYPGISALQLAPNGVVQKIFPLAGNEKAIGHNVLADPERDKEAFLARNSGKLTLAGPFPLLQGGLGAVGRMPVYIDHEQGGTRFWGFVTVLIRFPEVLNQARLQQLTERGYQYEVWRTHPDTGKKHVIADSSAGSLHDPVELALQVPNATWTLSLAPTKGWIDRMALIGKLTLALFVLMLLIVSSWRPRTEP